MYYICNSIVSHSINLINYLDFIYREKEPKKKGVTSDVIYNIVRKEINKTIKLTQKQH